MLVIDTVVLQRYKSRLLVELDQEYWSPIQKRMLKYALKWLGQEIGISERKMLDPNFNIVEKL